MIAQWIERIVTGKCFRSEHYLSVTFSEWKCATISTGTFFPHTIHLVLTAPLQSVQTNHLEIQWERKQKALHARSFHSAAPTLWNRLPDTLRCCIFSAAAVLFFSFFLKLFIHPPVSSSPSPELFSNSAFCIPLLTVPSQPLSFPIITKHNKHVAAYMESNCAMQADIDTDMDITVK